MSRKTLKYCAVIEMIKCSICGKEIPEASYEGQLKYDCHWGCFWGEKSKR